MGTKENSADLFTENLSHPDIEKFMSNLTQAYMKSRTDQSLEIKYILRRPPHHTLDGMVDYRVSDGIEERTVTNIVGHGTSSILL